MMGIMAKRVSEAKKLVRKGIFDDHWLFLMLEKLLAEGIIRRSQVLQREWNRVKKIFAP